MYAATPPAELGSTVTWTAFATDSAGNAGAVRTLQLRDVHVGEDEECGLPPFISLVRPSALGFASACDGGIANPCRYTLEVDTKRPSTCSYSPEATPDTWSKAIAFDTTTGLAHTKQVFFPERRILVNCTENANQHNHSRIFLVGYDLKAPVIGIEVIPSPTVVDPANSILTITATTDDLAYCYLDGAPFSDEIDTLDTDQFAYKQVHATVLDLRTAAEGQRTYQVMCRNLAGLSSSKSVNIVINYHTALQIDILSPPSFTTASDIILSVQPNKQSVCTYRANSTATPVQLAAQDGVHSVDLGKMVDGSYSYFVTCTASSQGESGTIVVPFTVDTTAPSIKSIEGKTILCQGEDATYTITPTGIDSSPTVEYTFQDAAVNTSRTTFTLKTRNLAIGSYTMSVIVINRAGLRSSPQTIDFEIRETSDPVCTVTSSHCSNQRQDIGERGVDCGGTCAKTCLACLTSTECGRDTCTNNICVDPKASCTSSSECGTDQACDAGLCIGKCLSDAECSEGQTCSFGVCAPPGSTEPITPTPVDACTNSLQDAGEEEIDCGGSCPACIACDDATPCADGKTCNEDHKCVPTEATCFDGAQNGLETGVDCGGPCAAQCEPAQNQCPDGNCSTESTCSDGVKDSDETGIDCGGQSCTPCQAKSHLLAILLLAFGAAIMGGSGYYLYQQNEEKALAAAAAARQRASMPSRSAPMQPMNPLLEQKYTEERAAREAALKAEYAKRQAEKEAQRKALMGSFDDGKQQTEKSKAEEKTAQSAAGKEQPSSKGSGT